MAEAQKGQEKVKDSPQGESSSPPLVGNTDTRISNHRKCWIYSPDVTVCGIYGPGTSQEIVANWSSPFENSTLGEMFQKVGGLIQAEKQMTSVTRFNTQQIWDNNRPTQFNLELKLYALRDANLEVMKPLAALEWMISTDVSVDGGGSIGGKIAAAVNLNIGTKVIYRDLCIDSISIPYDKEVDSQGNFVRCTVNVQFTTLTMITKDMLRKGYGFKAAF